MPLRQLVVEGAGIVFEVPGVGDCNTIVILGRQGILVQQQPPIPEQSLHLFVVLGILKILTEAIIDVDEQFGGWVLGTSLKTSAQTRDRLFVVFLMAIADAQQIGGPRLSYQVVMFLGIVVHQLRLSVGCLYVAFPYAVFYHRLPGIIVPLPLLVLATVLHHVGGAQHQGVVLHGVVIMLKDKVSLEGRVFPIDGF